MSDQQEPSEEFDAESAREVLPADQEDVESGEGTVDRLEGHHRGFDDRSGINPRRQQETDRVRSGKGTDDDDVEQ